MSLPYTRRTQEALQAAEDLPPSSRHPELSPLHLAVPLLEEPAGATAAMLSRLGVDAVALRAELARGLERLPRVDGARPAPGRTLAAVVDRSQADARKRGDAYLSTEHLLVGLAAEGGLK